MKLIILLCIFLTVGADNFTIICYNMDCDVKEPSFPKTLIEIYAKKYKHRVQKLNIPKGFEILKYDLAFIESDDYQHFQPNPFTLCSVTHFY